MKLMLTSAGIENKSLEKALKKLVGDGEIRIAFIPTAANIEEGDKDWLIDDMVKCKNLGEVDIVDISALEKDVWLSRLRWANVIFMEGGDTTHLMKAVRKSGFDEEIKDLLGSRVYVGVSAGSIILSESIQTTSEYLFKLYDDETKDPPKGLGIVDFDVRPHLNSPYFPKVTEESVRKVFEGYELDVYVLDDSSAVVWVDGDIEIVSEGDWVKLPKKEQD